MEITVPVIGHVRNDRPSGVGTDTTGPHAIGWDLIDSVIELAPDHPERPAIMAISPIDYSHVEVVVADPAVRTAICELMAVRPAGSVEVRGLDAGDATAVIGLRPHTADRAPRGDVRQPERLLDPRYWDGGSGRLDDATAAAWLAEVGRSPTEAGTLDLIVRRPVTDDREVIDTGELDLAVGLVGDNWSTRGSRARADGAADPDAQLNVMNTRCAALVAGSPERIPLAGDQLFVDLDLSPGNVPPGTRLAIGEAVIEVTAKPHNGCAKFTRRFGLAAHRWVNGVEGRAANLRGVCAIVVVPGTIRRGDTVRKLAAPAS